MFNLFKNSSRASATNNADMYRPFSEPEQNNNSFGNLLPHPSSSNDLNSLSVKEVIEKIHSEFENAGEQLLKEANEILSQNSNFCSEKSELLKNLGFVNTPEVKKADLAKYNIELSERTIKYVQTYSVEYPNNKFITEKMVQEICKKYNLVCADVSKYKGFVPLHNLKQIEDFTNRYEFNIWSNQDTYGDNGIQLSMGNYYIARGAHAPYYHFYNKKDNSIFLQSNDGIVFYGDCIIGDENIFVSQLRKCSLKICAPIKDMDTSGMRLKDGYKLIDWPDPVVLQPVIGGYLIVTAWGDESSDPLVLNEKLN